MRTKVTNGKTMLSIWSWLGKPRMNSDENKAKGVGFMLAPLENMKVYSDGFQPDGDGATIVAIGSKAKNKARLAKFIDWMYSPEGIYASSSNSGGAACPKDLGCFTTDKDGKNPTLTKFGQQAMTGDHANLKVSAKLGGSSYDDGYSKLNFKAVSQNDIDPNTGEAYNPLLWKSNQDETELFKDWSAHMENATNDIDYLQKAGKLSIAAGASYTTPTGGFHGFRHPQLRQVRNGERLLAGHHRCGQVRERPLTKPAPRSTTSATRKSSRSTSRTPRT